MRKRSTIQIDSPSLCPISATDIENTLERKVDFAMRLYLSAKEKQRLRKATINQTLGFTKHLLIFLNIEIKKEHAGIDPLVQLAVWIAAEFNKRAVEDYDRSIPVLAIAISGYTWELYIAYEPNIETDEVRDIVSRQSNLMNMTELMLIQQ